MWNYQEDLAHNQADEPDGNNDVTLRKGLAGLKAMWPAGYPQTFGLYPSLFFIVGVIDNGHGCCYYLQHESH